MIVRAVWLTLMVVSTLLVGCAGSLTFAVGEHARAAIAQPQTCAPSQDAPKVLGTRTTKTQTYDDKVGFKPQLETETTTTEPAIAPEAPQAPLQESTGASISETGGGVLKTALGFLGGVVKGMLGWLVP